MQPTEPSPPPAKVGGRRILAGGLFGVAAAALVNETLRRLVLETVAIPADFEPLRSGSVILLTVVGGAAATAAFLFVDRVARRPWKVYKVVAFGALLVSFIPDYLLLVSRAPGANAKTVGILASLHIVAFLVIMAAFGSAVGWKRPLPPEPIAAKPSRPA